ncbi:hypothetical protein C5Y96_02020 [Blastopirellula marina]|uniref:Uncharacterized protein n=1 Tax=Blastopirellula marina TaxID=124 RepID=A0A2S8G2N5_9BACT|nr:hypothetical protein C5Y96_02020 [Blastopirellula marina]RCS54991.1 hypothetical protein DTL36_02025 [Bremerella cremea]
MAKANQKEIRNRSRRIVSLGLLASEKHKMLAPCFCNKECVRAGDKLNCFASYPNNQDHLQVIFARTVWKHDGVLFACSGAAANGSRG